MQSRRQALLAPFLLFLASAWWYVQALPEPQRAWIVNFSPELAPFPAIFLCRNINWQKASSVIA